MCKFIHIVFYYKFYIDLEVFLLFLNFSFKFGKFRQWKNCSDI